MARKAVSDDIEKLGLSPDAAALLADILAENSPPVPMAANDAKAYAEPAVGDGEPLAAPAALAPVADPTVDAFTDMLNQLGVDDADVDALDVDEIGADEIAIDGLDVDGLDVDGLDVDQIDGEETEVAMISAPNSAPNSADDTKSATVSAAELEAIDAALADQEDPDANTKGGLLARFRRGTKDVHMLVGVKDASSAYENQARGSRFPSTLLRVLFLVVVAAVPPFVNLVFIQPQISNNNIKLSEMRQFEAKAGDDKKIALDLDQKIVRAQKISARLAENLPPSSDFEALFASYMAALERYGVEINSYNISSNEERSAPISNSKMIANLVEIELVGRYDVYAEIRRVFVEESRQIIVVDEIMTALPDSLDLNIKAKMIVPTRGKDSE